MKLKMEGKRKLPPIPKKNLQIKNSEFSRGTLRPIL